MQTAAAGPGYVRGDDQVGMQQVQQRLGDRWWLSAQHVQCRAAQMPAAQGLEQCGLIHQRATGGIDQHCARLDPRQLGRTDQPVRRGA
ncbi:hypothetical protein D3C72_2388990 [compost metagenome]